MVQGRWYDEQFFVTAAGTRGAQTGDWLLSRGLHRLRRKHHPGLLVRPRHHPPQPDRRERAHSNDFMDMEMLEYIQYQLKTMSHPPKPCMIDGEELYLLILNPYSEWTLHKAAGGDWAQIKKYARKARTDLPRLLGRFGSCDVQPFLQDPEDQLRGLQRGR